MIITSVTVSINNVISSKDAHFIKMLKCSHIFFQVLHGYLGSQSNSTHQIQHSYKKIWPGKLLHYLSKYCFVWEFLSKALYLVESSSSPSAKNYYVKYSRPTKHTSLFDDLVQHGRFIMKNIISMIDNCRIKYRNANIYIMLSLVSWNS